MRTPNPWKLDTLEHAEFEALREDYPEWVLAAMVDLSERGLVPSEIHLWDEVAHVIQKSHNPTEKPMKATAKLFQRTGHAEPILEPLANGAKILAQAPAKGDDGAVVVLADTGPHNVQRLVCWMATSPENTFWGRYGREAIPSFNERAEVDAETAMLAALMDTPEEDR